MAAIAPGADFVLMEYHSYVSSRARARPEVRTGGSAYEMDCCVSYRRRVLFRLFWPNVCVHVLAAQALFPTRCDVRVFTFGMDCEAFEIFRPLLHPVSLVVLASCRPARHG